MRLKSLISWEDRLLCVGSAAKKPSAFPIAPAHRSSQPDELPAPQGVSAGALPSIAPMPFRQIALRLKKYTFNQKVVLENYRNMNLIDQLNLCSLRQGIHNLEKTEFFEIGIGRIKPSHTMLPEDRSDVRIGHQITVNSSRLGHLRVVQSE